MFSSISRKFPLLRLYIPVLFLFVIAAQNTDAQTSFVKNEKANPLQRFAVASSRMSYPVFTDIDNDGDLDCFSGEFNYSQSGVVSSHIAFYRNNGNAKHPLFTQVESSGNPLQQVAITGSVIPVFADIDGDGDPDCFIANSNGSITFYKNTGTAEKAVFVKQSAAFNPLSGARFSGIDISSFLLQDIDKDGDIDCLLTDKEGNELYYANAGSATQPKFVNKESDNLFAVVNNTVTSALSLYDWNKDGRPDLFAGNTYYQNNTGRFAKQTFSPVSSDDSQTTTSWVDLDADGTPELISGTTDGRFTYSTLPSVNTTAVASVIVSPNPATKYFTVSLPASAEQKTLKVISADGKTVLSQTIAGSTYTFGSSLEKGTYVVQVLSLGKMIAQSKIVKL